MKDYVITVRCTRYCELRLYVVVVICLLFKSVTVCVSWLMICLSHWKTLCAMRYAIR